MKRIALGCFLVLLMSALCLAQGARNPQTATLTGREDATTYFTNVGAVGLDTGGNPGYFVLTGTQVEGSTTPITYYLWVDDTGDLCVASYTTIQAYASFPTGDWGTDNMNSACTKVGGQS